MHWCAISLALCCMLTGVEETPLRNEYPVGAGGRLFAGPDPGALLARPWAEHVPMACTGEALWAGHPGGWAFGSDTHFYLHAQGDIGFDLNLEALSRPLRPESARAFPSHVELEGGFHIVRVRGAKWITPDDVLAVSLVFENDSDTEPATVDTRLVLPLASPADASGNLAWTAHAGGLEVFVRGFAPGFAQEVSRRPGRQYVTEGEDPDEQRGSAGIDEKPAASGGRVLGNSFGARAGDYAAWTITVPEPMEDAALSLRYARAGMGPAAFSVEAERVWSGEHAFEPTGGWGYHEHEFAIAVLPLGPLAAGDYRVRMAAREDGANLNVDALALHERARPFVPEVPASRALARRIELPPRGRAELRVFAAAAVQPDRAEHALARVRGLEDPLADQIAASNTWLRDHVPSFSSENAALEKLYWHRAVSVLRKNLLRPGAGRLTRWAMAEGRWASTWFPNVISFGAGHQIRELRWLRDPLYVRDYISTWCENQREDGIFPSHIPAAGPLPGGQYADWITAAAWDAHCVHPDADTLRAWTPALMRNIDGWMARYDADNDGLLLVDSHWWTGMEWQPSFFYFNGWDKDRQGQHLERVDLTSYVYGGARNLGRMLEEIGDTDGAQRYTALAKKIRDALVRRMWDVGTGYFYPVDPDTHEKALVKEVAGIYPYYFEMFDPVEEKRFTRTWSALTDPAELWTEWPVATASRQCPAYSQDTRFHGKEVGGCMWNGPTWPHANSFVLAAMGHVLRRYDPPPIRLAHFQKLLVSYTMAQFRGQDLQFPWTGEFYNGDTGEWRTEERDYNHSTFIDIVVTELAGLRPRADQVLEIHPLIDAHTPGFILDGIRYRGHDITIAWSRWEAPTPGPDGRKGFRIYANGKLLYHSRPNVIPRTFYRDLDDGL